MSLTEQQLEERTQLWLGRLAGNKGEAMDYRKNVARYIIILDRYDDDDYGPSDNVGYGHDGSAQAAVEQVAAELQEAMENHGTPAGFFNVIERRMESTDDPKYVPVRADPRELTNSLGIRRRMENN